MKLSWRGLNSLFFIAMLLEQLAQGHLTAFTPLLLHDLGLTPAEVSLWTGLLFTVTMVVAFPLTPFWGVLAERYSRRLVIVRSYYIETAAYLLCFFAADVRWLVGARILLGLTFGNVATIMATQATVTPRNRLGSALATVQAAQPIAASLGPPLGAALLPWFGLRTLFLLDAGMVLIAGLLVTFMLQEPTERNPKAPIFGRARGVIGDVWREPPLRWNFVGAFTVRGAQATVDTYLPVRITQVVGVDSAPAIGAILGIYGALTALSTWLVGRWVDRVDQARLFARAMVGAVFITGALALVQNIWLIGVLAVLRSIPVAMSNTLLLTHLARALPRSQQTAVMSLQPVPRTIGGLVFPLLASLIAPLWGGAALAVAALSYVGAALAGQKMADTSTAPGQESD